MKLSPRPLGLALLLALAALGPAMAEPQRIDQLTASAAVSGTDSFAVCQGCDSTTGLRNLTMSTIVSYLNSNLTLSLSRITSGLGAGVATFLGTPSSATLRSALTDETGTGAAYFQGGDLGTPIAGNLANASGYVVSNLGGLSSGVATFLGTPSSANLRASLTDETGSGSAVFAVGPTVSGMIHSDITGSTQCLHVNSSGLVTGTGADCGAGSGGAPGGTTGAIQYNSSGTLGGAVINGIVRGNGSAAPTAAVADTDYLAPGGALGTPASATLTNATGLPVSTGIAGLAAGAATFLGTPSSANLRTLLTDESGTGAAVFGTSPSISGLTLSNVTGSTQCLHVNTVGLVTGTGSDCGSGGGGTTTVTDGTNSVSATTTLTFDPTSFVVSGSAGSATVKPTTGFNPQTGATYTVLTTDASKSVLMTNASPTTVTLLSAASAGSGFSFFIECDAGCTINRAGSDTIDGATSLVLAANQKAYLETTATNWRAGVVSALNPQNAANLNSGTVAAARGGAGTISGIMKANGSGVVSQATAGTDYVAATTGSAIQKASSGGLTAAVAGTDYAAAVPAGIGWVAAVDPNKAVILTASRAMTVTDIRGTVADAVGAAATLSVYKAPSGTACSSGTIQHSGTFNANGTVATNQTLTLVGGAGNVLAAGDRLCLSTANGAVFAAGSGNGGLTVTLQVQ